MRAARGLCGWQRGVAATTLRRPWRRPRGEVRVSGTRERDRRVHALPRRQADPLPANVPVPVLAGPTHEPWPPTTTPRLEGRRHLPQVIRQRGNSFEVVVYRGREGGRSRKVSRTIRGTDKAARLAARQVELDLQAEVADGRAQDGAGATFGQLIDRWLRHARIEESTRYQARHALEKHVRPVLGDRKLSRLRAEDLDDLYHSLERRRGKRKLAPSTVRRLHATIRSVLAMGVKLRWIARNPADDASPPAEHAREPVAPSTAAVVAFLAALDDEPELAMFVRLDAVTGMRRAEVCALRRSDLDLDAGALRKSRSLGMAQGAPYVKGTKSGARHALALDAETVHRLKLHLKAQDEIAALNRTTVGDGYVFSLEVNCSRPMRPDYVTKRVRARRDQVPGAETITLRSLRHWMATQGLQSGASVKAVSGRAGHARTSTTTDRYAAWIPASDRTLAHDLAAALDE